MKNNYLLGIDIGTFGSKGVIVTPEGKVEAEHSVEHGLSLPQPGWAEHDAIKIWWQDFKTLIKHLTQKAHILPAEIAAVGVSALGPDLQLVDKEGNCLRSAILYGIDNRAQKQIEKINKILGEKYIFNLTGNSLSAQSLLPKILWVQENQPEIFKKTYKLLTASSFIAYKLTDKFCMDYLSASAAGLVNIYNSKWATELLEEFNVSLNLFPRLAWATEIAGKVTHQASDETGLEEGVPVIVGSCDVGAEAISAGVIEPGETILVYGSTMAILQCLSKPIIHPDLLSGFYCLPNVYYNGGATASGAALTRWFRDNFGQLEILREKQGGTNAYDLLNDEIIESGSGPSGLIALPFFSGARTPLNDSEAKGVIAGLTLSHKRVHLYKALLEGVGYEVRHVFDIMEQAGASPKRILAVGGGIKNTVWPQIISDIIGREQDCVARALGAPFGSAFLAGLGTNIISDINLLKHKWVKIGRKVKPSSSINHIYQKYYQLYHSLYKETKKSIHLLGEYNKEFNL